ncbi:MAG: hypothetical protein PVH29_00375 [Candidatus Zixiibacteriota bacterium]
MRRLVIFGSVVVISAVAAFAAVYDANQKVALTPVIAVRGDDIYVAWARLGRMLKFGRFTLSPVHGGEAHLQTSVPMTSRTNEPFALAMDDDSIFLSWVDYGSGKAELAHYKIKGKEKIDRVDTRNTSIRTRGGVSLAYGDGRLFVGYTDEKEDLIRIATYNVSSKGKLSRENERKLTECETVVGSSIALSGDTMVVAWMNSEKKFMLTTYAVEKSSKGPTYRHLKETRTEIRARTDPMDKPAVAVLGDEIYLGYVDRNDKTARVKFYQLNADGSTKSAGETRVNERPGQPITVAASADKVYVALMDNDNRLLIAEQ